MMVPGLEDEKSLIAPRIDDFMVHQAYHAALINVRETSNPSASEISTRWWSRRFSRTLVMICRARTYWLFASAPSILVRSAEVGYCIFCMRKSNSAKTRPGSQRLMSRLGGLAQVKW